MQFFALLSSVLCKNFFNIFLKKFLYLYENYFILFQFFFYILYILAILYDKYLKTALYLCLIIYVQIANIAKHKSIVLWFVLNTCVLYREVFKKLYRLFWFHHKTNLLCEQIWTEPTFSVPRNREATQTWKFGTVKKLYILRILTLLLQIQCKKKKITSRYST